MSIVPYTDKSIEIWEGKENLQQIKNLFAPKLTELEFIAFVELGKRTGLSPFLREIWAVKYDGQNAQIFIGRDGYRKSAQRNPLYDYHLADAVYSNDIFMVKDGEVGHQYSLKDRGTLVGSYCTVQRKGALRPTYVFVELNEYNTKKSVWSGKPATMIKKVAEAQCLRMAFQELLGGTHHEFEYDLMKPDQSTYNKPGKGINGLKEKLGLTIENNNEQSSEVIDQFTDEDEPCEITVDYVRQYIIDSKTKEDISKVKEMASSLSKEERITLHTLYSDKKKELGL